jgi:1,4-alpha-glucan branching enzyme
MPAKAKSSKVKPVWNVPQAEIEAIVNFDHGMPSKILGLHRTQDGKGMAICAFKPSAVEAWIRLSQKTTAKKKMQCLHSAGFFQWVTSEKKGLFEYKIGFRHSDGTVEESEDAYVFLPDITDYDLHLIGEGNHLRSYEKLGAHNRTCKGVKGIQFSVWAPNARSVAVVGDFNGWRVGAHMMSRIKGLGIWSIFVPGLGEGEIYKFAIKSPIDHQVRFKIDPYAFQTELRPRSASVTHSLKDYRWNDRAWLEARARKSYLDSPISIYEVHPGSWKVSRENETGFLTYRELAHQLVDYAKAMGYTHLELMPVTEHPLDASWGYQVINYFAPTSRFGKPEDFKYFVDYCHRNGIGVILDWVPSHFPKDAHGLADYDGRQIYAYEDWRKGEHKEWGTLVFDFARNEVRNFLLSNALFWLDQYHLDGLRVDAVASMIYLDYSRKDWEWTPNCYGGHENLEAIDWLKRFNEIVHASYPGVLTIAEESTAWPKVSKPIYDGGLGFSMKWNMGWMHDSLEYFSKDPVYRKYHHGTLTFSMLYAFSENFILPISHDEVVHGKRSLLEKMPGDDWQKFANVRLFYGYMYGTPGKKLHFMGNEIGQRREWNCHDSLDWHLIQEDWHNKLNRYVADLNRLYRECRAFHEVDFNMHGFEWIDFSDWQQSIISFVRWSRDYKQMLLFVYNMTPVPRIHYRVGAPLGGYYKEILNSDAYEYGGSGVGNHGGRHTDDVAWQGRPYSLSLNLPPLAVTVFRYDLQ